MTADGRARARQDLLAGEIIFGTDLGLADTVARLAVTAEDRAQARQALLALLAGETSPRKAWELADAVARLSATVADLGGSDNWPFPPTPALLAAARQNSGLPAWLAALPLLSVRSHHS